MKLSFLPLIVLALLVGCSPPGGGKTAPADSRETGYFIDGPLAGLSYETSSGSTGVTDSNGAYRYEPGDTVTFLLGGQTLGTSVAAATTVTPLTLYGATALDDTEAGQSATNLIRLFLALDDGSNPYGLTIPAATEEALQTADTSLNDLVKSDTFAADAASLLDDAGVTADDVPAADAAKEHWDLSEQLIESVEESTEDNLVVAVRIPDGYVGATLKINYNAETVPTGMTSYVSGTEHFVSASDDGMIVFTGKLHSSHWRLNLSLFQSSTGASTADLLTFYHADGFGQELPTGFDLDMTGGKRLLQADLSSGEAVKVQAVHSVSGTLVLPKVLPNNANDDLKDAFDNDDFSIFASLKIGSSNAAQLSVTLPLGSPGNWNPVTKDGVDCYSIPFTTTMPADFTYQFQSYYRNSYDTAAAFGNFDTFAFYTLSSPLVADVSGVELADTTWAAK